jgi:hypothetical protein
MVADPISTIREACGHFGYDFPPEYETRARRYIAENPRHKHGVHLYDGFDQSNHLKGKRYEDRGEDSLGHRRQPRHRRGPG